MDSSDRNHQSTVPSVLKKRKTPARKAPDYGLAALEDELSNDAFSFRNFAKAKDFSGENIMFLDLVKGWKASWTQMVDEAQRRRNFNAAVKIYVTCVDLISAEYPVNLDSNLYQDLRNIFGEAANYHGIPVSGNPVAPFESTVRVCDDNDSTYTSFPSLMDGAHPVRVDGLAAPTNTPRTSWDNAEYKFSMSKRNSKNAIMEPNVPEDFPIPDAFNETVFDEAAESIKLLILRDTWPKYLDYKAEADQGNQNQAAAKANQQPRRTGWFPRLLKKIM